MNRRLTAVGTAALALGFVAVAFAQDMTPDQMVNIRQGRFKEIAISLKTITDELKKRRPLKIMMTTSASQIPSAAREQAMMFPRGTGPSSGIKMKAKVEIWERREEFDARLAQLVAEGGKLATLARGQDLDAARAQVKVVAQVCEDCHKVFRSEDD